METRSGFNPATQAMEAHCEDCGGLVATLARDLQESLDSPHVSYQWFGLYWNGVQNHRRACHGHRTE